MVKHMGRFWALLFLGVASHAHAEEDKIDVGQPAPVFTLRAVNPEVTGASLSAGADKYVYVGLDRFVGHDATEAKKAVLISFFASDCEPCKHEMPFLALLFDGYKDKGLQVLSVTIDKEPDRIDVAHTLGQQSQVKFPILSDHFNYVAKRYLVNRLPSVYLVDADGKVGLVKTGYNDDASKELHDEVRKALGLPGSEPVPAALTTYFATPHQWGQGKVVMPQPTPQPSAVAAPANPNGKAAVVSPGAADASSAQDANAAASDDDDKSAKGKRKGKRKAVKHKAGD